MAYLMFLVKSHRLKLMGQEDVFCINISNFSFLLGIEIYDTPYLTPLDTASHQSDAICPPHTAFSRRYVHVPTT